jgi:hypothetical protein
MGLGKLIEVEKERADRQSLLRWTMVGASDTRETRATAAEKMRTTREKRVSPETAKRSQKKEHGEKRREKQWRKLIHRLRH